MNRYGVDTAYFQKQLKIVERDLENYTPSELVQVFTNLADAVKPQNNCPKCKNQALTMFDSDNNICKKCDTIVSVC